MENKSFVKAAAGLLLALGICYNPMVMAKEVLLAETEVLYKSNNIKAQLWGNKVNTSYANDLTLVLKREDDTVITGYKPDIKGGYGATLKAVQVKAKDKDTQQLLLGVRQGDWRVYSEYRVLDIENPKALKELFSGADGFGIVTSAKLEGNTLRVQTVKDREPLKIELNPKMVEDIAANRRQVSFAKLQSVTAIDLDKNGVNELITNQHITVNNRLLADVGAVWRYIGTTEEDQKEKTEKNSDKISPTKAKENKGKEDIFTSFKESLETISKELQGNEAAEKQEEPQKKQKDKLWKQDGLTIMKSDIPNKKNSINNGAFFSGGMVYPVKMVSPSGEATYPQFMLNENVELEAAWNKVLMDEAENYIWKFLHGKADLAFNVIRADKKLLTVQLISGKTTFDHHNISFIPGEKEKYELDSLLKVKAKGLVELLNVLNNNKKLTWDKELTDEWYIRNNTLYLMKNVNGNDEVASFELKNLKSYIIDQRFLPEEEQEDKAQAKKEQKVDTKDKK